MNKQEIFDKVVLHLLTQNQRSVTGYGGWNRGSCRYRGVDGLKCAIGCLIADEEYSPEFEGMSINAHDGVELWNAISRSIGMSYCDVVDNLKFFRALQIIHDNEEIPDWKHELKYFADKQGLSKDVFKFFE